MKLDLSSIDFNENGLDRACCLFNTAKLALIKLNFHSTNIQTCEQLNQKQLVEKYRYRYMITLAAYDRLMRAYKKQLFNLLTSFS